jgi:hypothetical protein
MNLGLTQHHDLFGVYLFCWITCVRSETRRRPCALFTR